MNVYKKLGFNNLTEVQTKIQNIKKNILIVSSCGSGKTEASYFNMLQDKSRMIFIEPMRTLSDNIHDRLNTYNKKLGIESVTIQHSANKGDIFLSNKYSVTTIDQVLSGYLALGRQSFMRGKNILRSNLIFDEVQLFGTEDMLLTTINMLDEINKLNQRFIIMTATMPQFLIDFLSERYDMEVIISEELRNDRKVKLYYNDELNYETINDYQDKQIIICNTVKQLRTIYAKLDKTRIIVLHSKFLNSDRRKIEEDVLRYFGKHSSNNNKILLTTQIVEVGIDISANRLYSSLCPIDNLIQRDGRCCRWGGEGDVIVFYSDDKIYDKDNIHNTLEFLLNNQGINFTWDIQKQAVNDILNPYYNKMVNKVSLKKNRNNFKYCDRSKLIRDIQTVNLIIADKDDITIEDFNRETISIYINELKNISQNNELYIVNHKNIETIDYYKVEIGDTILIRGNGCLYDNLGFRYEDNVFVKNSNILFNKNGGNNTVAYEDYIEETWLHHAESVKDLLSYKLNQEYFNHYVTENRKKIAFYGGLHDLGKLDIEWLKKSDSNKILAHFPFKVGHRGEFRTHHSIGAYILKDFINDDIIFNLILQHHKRIPVSTNLNKTSRWRLHKDTYKLLKEYGFNEDNIRVVSDEVLIKNADIITPCSDKWTTLLYLIGTFMECEIEAIQEYIHKNCA